MYIDGYGGSPPRSRAELRAALEEWIIKALDILDALDGDPDLEPDAGDEDEIDHLREWRVQ